MRKSEIFYVWCPQAQMTITEAVKIESLEYHFKAAAIKFARKLLDPWLIPPDGYRILLCREVNWEAANTIDDLIVDDITLKPPQFD